ncbi:hypothetical protein MKX01_017223, partial [Papaver californicum]
FGAFDKDSVPNLMKVKLPSRFQSSTTAKYEPTSGLDSSSSKLFLRALGREALEGVNICTVIHQP